jgi:hypothetical protein
LKNYLVCFIKHIPLGNPKSGVRFKTDENVVAAMAAAEATVFVEHVRMPAERHTKPVT